jgi:hypothetical protein
MMAMAVDDWKPRNSRFHACGCSDEGSWSYLSISDNGNVHVALVEQAEH